MADPLVWILAGIGAYWAAVVWLERRGLLPTYIGTQGPILTVHTGRFRALLDRVARPRRLWRAWGNFGLGVALVVMTATFAFLAFAAVATVRDPTPTAVNQPRNVLVIPGVNDFLPLSAAPEIVLGLLIGLVVHEGGHAVLCRVGDIDVKSMGLALFAIIPIGAFVEPDDESRRRADRGDQTRMFAAGVMNNFAVTVVAFALLFGPIVGAMTVAPGAAVGGVLQGSSAQVAGIDTGDRIVAVEGEAIGDNADLGTALGEIDERTVSVTFVDGATRERRTTQVTRSLLVTGTLGGGPFAGAVPVGTTIVAVDGQEVHTERAFREALDSRSVATLRTEDGTEVTGPVGASVQIQGDGPAADSGVPVGPAVVTALDETRIVDAADLSAFMDGTRPDQVVTAELYVGDEPRTEQIRLGDHPDGDGGYLGVLVAPGASGITVSDFGARLYPAGDYLRVLGGGDGAGLSFAQRTIVALQLPLASLTGSGLPFNFAGFTGGVANFYTFGGPLGTVGGLAFGLANLLFWTGWINLNLGVFNCIPAFPLDGGHLLRASTEAVVSRLPVGHGRSLTTMVTTGVGLAMLASLLLTIFGPRLLT